LVTQFKRPHCTRRMPANDITLTQMSHMSQQYQVVHRTEESRENDKKVLSRQKCFYADF
jgi:hypothetical protein